ncbi:sugar ABC transporter ATP-binding protein [Lachnospiraceae bacterium 64-25]|nr:ribose import ATP-binding protein RbsA [Lachnospiraceae bacterium]
MGNGKQLLEMKHICKAFPGVVALNDVSFDLHEGEVHALMGENGAGKSTLMKILTGTYKQDSGDIVYKGEILEKRDEKFMLSMGVAIIHQELSYVPHLTIAENLFLGREIVHHGVLHQKEMNEKAAQWLANVGVDLNPKRLMKSLMVSEQQMVEIAKAISYDANIIVMDEPTSAITDREVENLFKVIADLKAKGVGIIYISHKMDEILRISDRVTVFRDGCLVDTFQSDEVDIDQIIIAMVGRKLTDVFPKRSVEPGEEMLRIDGLTRKGVFEDVSFAVRRGEVLGVAGLMGAGRTEVMRCVCGLDKYDKGEIYVNGKEARIRTPKDAIANGIGLINEDRKGVGLVLPLSVKHNLTLSNLNKYFKTPLLVNRKENELADKEIKELHIKTPGRNYPVRNLSGGNQQKVVLGKVMLDESEILIMDEPTRGIDVGAKVEIYQLINDFVKNGKAVIVISSEMPELIGLSDRIVIMHEGKLVGKIDQKQDITQEKIMEYVMKQ